MILGKSRAKKYKHVPQKLIKDVKRFTKVEYFLLLKNWGQSGF